MAPHPHGCCVYTVEKQTISTDRRNYSSYVFFVQYFVTLIVIQNPIIFRGKCDVLIVVVLFALNRPV